MSKKNFQKKKKAYYYKKFLGRPTICVTTSVTRKKKTNEQAKLNFECISCRITYWPPLMTIVKSFLHTFLTNVDTEAISRVIDLYIYNILHYKSHVSQLPHQSIQVIL